MRKPRKFLFLLCLCLSAAMLLPCLAGCGDDDEGITALGDLSREKVIEIRDACFERYYAGELFATWRYDKSQLKISRYYGTFGSNIVVGVVNRSNPDAGWDCALHDLIVDDVLVVRQYSNPYTVYVYDDAVGGKEALSLLDDAYAAGRISRDELGQIALVGRETDEYAYLQYGYDAGQTYVSDMTQEEMQAVRSDYLHALYPDAPAERVVHISIEAQLYTCADGSVVFCMREDRIGLRQGVAAKGEVPLIVGGTEICVFPNEEYGILVYTPARACLSLQAAYGTHVLEEELQEIVLQARKYLSF